jgi:hypothetical protein
MSEEKRNRRGGIVGPLILISLGVIFLLNNLGVLDWSVWEILLRLWPAILIAAGLDLILGRRSIWGSLLALVLTFAVLGVALWLSGAGVGASRAMRTEEIVQPLEDLNRAEVVIDPGVGTLRVEAGVDSENLVEGEVRVSRREELVPTFSAQGESGTFRLRTDSSSFGPFAVDWMDQRDWNLQLNPSIPLRLETDLGVGRTDIDLTGLTVESLDVGQGIGQAVVVLPDEGEPDVSIDGAIGQTIVVIPENLAVRVRLDTGIAGRQIPEGYACEEDVCTSPGYETADQRVELELGQAIGSLVIRH